MWSGSYTKNKKKNRISECRSKRVEVLKQIGLIIAQTSSIQPLVCVESIESHISFLIS